MHMVQDGSNLSDITSCENELERTWHREKEKEVMFDFEVGIIKEVNRYMPEQWCRLLCCQTDGQSHPSTNPNLNETCVMAAVN